MDRAVALRGLEPARTDRSRRRAERGLVAAYIHELSRRHADERARNPRHGEVTTAAERASG
jgi:hypothetical protein